MYPDAAAMSVDFGINSSYFLTLGLQSDHGMPWHIGSRAEERLGSRPLAMNAGDMSWDVSKSVDPIASGFSFKGELGALQNAAINTRGASLRCQKSGITGLKVQRHSS